MISNSSYPLSVGRIPIMAIFVKNSKKTYYGWLPKNPRINPCYHFWFSLKNNNFGSKMKVLKFLGIRLSLSGMSTWNVKIIESPLRIGGYQLIKNYLNTVTKKTWKIAKKTLSHLFDQYIWRKRSNKPFWLSCMAPIAFSSS